ncbi:MAG: hypothetical protein ACREWI_10305, partial [Telluria sp.]
PILTVWACLASLNLNHSNRPVRTRMPGGVGGANQHADCPYPVSPRQQIKYFRTDFPRFFGKKTPLR